MRLRRNELIGYPGCVEQRAAEFFRERLRLIVDLKQDPDHHPRMKEEIGEARWLVTVLIEPDTYIRQSLDEIIAEDTLSPRD